MGAYKQVFTLRDIFTDKDLAGKLPIINYKEVETENGVKQKTNIKTIKRQVFDTSIFTARPYYTDFKAIRGTTTLDLSGTLKGNGDECQNAVYQALLGIKDMLSMTANNSNMIREAIKESEKVARRTGIDTKLYLRISSKQEIKNMSKRQLIQFMQDVMENIYYGDFFETQQKYKVEEMSGFKKSYDERADAWNKKIGN